MKPKPGNKPRSQTPERPLQDFQGNRRELEALIHSLDGILYEFDVPTQSFTFVSRSAERILGYPLEQWREGMSFWAGRLHPDDREWAVRFCFEKIQALEDHEFEYRMITAAGATVWIQDRVTVVAAEGASLRLRGVMVDVSRRKQAEEGLHCNEELFRAAFEGAETGMAILDREGRFIRLNPAFCGIFGFPPEGLSGKSFLDLTHPEERDSCREFLASWTEPTGMFLQTEKRYLHRTGQIIWGQVNLSVIRDEVGRPSRIFCQIQDVTDAKQNREELHLFRSLINQSNDAIFIVDPRSARILYVNDKACDNLGYSPSELMAMRIVDFAANVPDIRAWKHLVRRLRRDGRGFFETRQQRRDGSSIPVEINVRLVKDDSGEFLVSVARDVSERLRVEDALAEEKNKVEAIMEAMGEGIAAIDREFRIIYQNGVHRSRQGDHVGERCFQGFHGRAELCEGCALELAFADGRIHRREVDVETATGVLSLEVTACPLRDAGGKIVAGVEVVRDVTERRRTEEALRNSERRYRAVVEEMTELLCRFRPDGMLNFVNDAYCRYFQRERGQLLEHSMLELVAPEDRPRVLRQLTELTPGNPMVTTEIRVLAPGSGTRWQRWTGRAFFDEEGGIVEIQAHGHDVTSRKLTEDLLRQSENRFRRLSHEFQTLLDGIPDGLLHLSTEFRIRWANRAVARKFKTDQKPLEGRLCFEAFHGRDLPCERCPVELTLREGGKGNSQVLSFGDSHCEVRTFPISEADGRVSSVIVVKRDVTDQVKMEQEAMRTAHLISLGELAAGVAHEINNPINGIINYAQILHDRIEPGSRNQELTARIIREGDRIGAIVANLLFFARHDNGERAPVALREVLMDALFLAQPQLRKDQIILQVEIEESLPPVLGIPQKIEQVFLNILHNARDALAEKYAGPDSGKIIKVTAGLAENSDRSPPRVRISFEDLGAGIPAEVLPRVTQPFFTTKPMGRGTGLGLSICHNIVVDHGGHLFLESEPGRFTRVHVELPALPAEER